MYTDVTDGVVATEQDRGTEPGEAPARGRTQVHPQDKGKGREQY